MFINKYTAVIIMFLQYCPLFSQSSLQKKADSTQTVLASFNKTDTTRIVRAGEYIVKNSGSYKQKFETLEKISATYFRVNNINKSIAYAFKAKAEAEKSADAEMMAQANGSIANLYSYLNLTPKARPYLNEAIRQIERLPTGNKRCQLKALSYLELGNLDFNDRNYAAANKNYRQSLQEFNRVKNLDDNNKYHYRRSLYNIGNSYLCLKQPDSAETYLNRALVTHAFTNPDLKYYIYATLANVYSLKGGYRRAIDTLQTIVKDRNFNISSLKAEVYLDLSKNYKNIGDNTNYTLYNEKHLVLRDTVNGTALKAIDTAFNAEQKDYAASIQESKQNNRRLSYGIAVVVLLSLGIVLRLKHNKKKEHAAYLAIIKRLKSQITSSPEINTDAEKDVKPVYTISVPVEEEILLGLQKFETSEGFRNPKITVSMLAVQLKTNPAYLSAVIKAHKDKNFNTYINELRIRYICQKIHTHREYEKYKISYLAEDCGFASHSAFSTVFKKVTGISPSVFLREEENSYTGQSVA